MPLISCEDRKWNGAERNRQYYTFSLTLFKYVPSTLTEGQFVCLSFVHEKIGNITSGHLKMEHEYAAV